MSEMLAQVAPLLESPTVSLTAGALLFILALRVMFPGGVGLMMQNRERAKAPGIECSAKAVHETLPPPQVVQFWDARIKEGVAQELRDSVIPILNTQTELLRQGVQQQSRQNDVNETLLQFLKKE